MAKTNKIKFLIPDLKIGSLLLILLSVLTLILFQGCTQNNVPGSEAKVAKVDTEYIYEANISKFVADFRESRRVRISTFIGFTPDDILMAREQAIKNEIRGELKRLPGVVITSEEKRVLADEMVEELAKDLYARIMEDPSQFEDLAREYSVGINARNGGSLPGFGKLDNPEPYHERAYLMKEGEITEPFSAWDGWRILRLDKLEDDEFTGKSWHISMIFLTPDQSAAEAKILDGIALEHTVEILDSKYNARQAIEADDGYTSALAYADEAIEKNAEDDLAHYLMAKALWGMTRSDEAIAEMELASASGKVSDGLIPYYHLFRGQYLESLDRTEEALEAYHASFDTWRQDINLAKALEITFENIGDAEYLQKIRDEIDIIVQQDAIALGLDARGTGPTGVIVFDNSSSSDSSVEFEPGYRAKD